MDYGLQIPPLSFAQFVPSYDHSLTVSLEYPHLGNIDVSTKTIYFLRELIF